MMEVFTFFPTTVWSTQCSLDNEKFLKLIKDFQRKNENSESSNNIQPQLNNLINSLSSTILSSLSSAIQNPDNSGNTISAEYSVIFPSHNNNNNNNNNINN